ncbi:MAG: hypothetical protein QE271_07245 [Bacteriovoracaceae bacterium]|nr:hypothetical protein [Bacteriovoracaceae bacterium]
MEITATQDQSRSLNHDHERMVSTHFIGKFFPTSQKYTYSKKFFETYLQSDLSWMEQGRILKNYCESSTHPLVRQVFEVFFNIFIFFLHSELKQPLPLIAKHLGLTEKFIITSLRSTYLKLYPHKSTSIQDFFYLGRWIYQGDSFLFRDMNLDTHQDQAVHSAHPISVGHLWRYREFEQILQLNQNTVFPPPTVTASSITSDEKIPEQKSIPLFYGWWGKVFRETTIILFIFVLFIFSYNKFSKIYQSYLLKEIAALEINHSAPDTKLVFKTQVPPAKRKIELSVDEFKNIQTKFNNPNIPDFLTPETDILATTVDFGQKQGDRYSIFSFSNSEDDFRDTQYGFYKSYRLLVKSSDIFASKSKILDLVKKFEISPVTNELVGNEIPGGVFFNLHVPSKNIESFVRELNSTDSVNVYISKSSRPSPPGKEKVFVWIKEI